MSKRIFDVCVAAVLLALFAPIMTIIALAIKLDSKGFVIFRQQRVGYRGRLFTILKFRSMRADSGKPYDMVLKDDPRITRVGRWLRPAHLDELPQLWNIIRGDMRLVGPRPVPLGIMELRIREYSDFGKQYKVQPGLTGLAQLRGRTKNLQKGARSEVLLNRYYEKHQSTCFDCKILLFTALAMIGRRGV